MLKTMICIFGRDEVWVLMSEEVIHCTDEIKFECKGKTKQLDDSQCYVTYGLVVIRNFEQIGEIEDISLNQTQIEQFARQLTKEKASIIHFEELVLDYIS